MQDKIAKLNEKIDALQEKMTINAAAMEEKRNATKEQIDADIDTACKNVEATKEHIEDSADKAKTVAAEEVGKVRAGIEAAKQKITDRKEAIDQARLERYIDDVVDYAASCLETAALAIGEAKLATLEAIAAQMEYDEKYGA